MNSFEKTKFSQQESAYYRRQLILSEFGPEAQAKLKKSKVLVVGAGGLGSPALLYLAGAGIGNLIIMDADTVNYHNLHRQLLYTTEDVGKRKVEVAADHLHKVNPHINITPIPEYLTIENVRHMVSGVDVVIDATDNFETRFVLGKITAELQVPLVFAAVFAFEGQLSVFNYKHGPSFHDLFSNEQGSSSIMDCATNGIIGLVPGTMGCLQACEAIKIITGIGTVLSGRLMIINLLTMEEQKMKIKYNKLSADKTGHETMATPGKIIREITSTELKQRMVAPNNHLFILDVREPLEYEEYNIDGTLIPLGMLPERLGEIPMDKDIVVVCQSGIRSMRAAEYIHANLRNVNVMNLRGGLKAWIRESKGASIG
jgi:adenylyltransferase/sulfurtransferase